MRERSLKLVLAALFAAIVCVITFFPKIPIAPTGGYIHLGDAFCLTAAWLLGPVYGSLAAGIGSAAADTIGGYYFYVPATFIIKTLAYLVAGLIFAAFKKKHGKALDFTVSAAVGESIMVAGYFLFEWLYLSSPIAAVITGVPANIAQAVAGAAAGTAITNIVFRNKFLSEIFNKIQSKER